MIVLFYNLMGDFMSRFALLILISLALLLSSCYQSPSDLIGDHANVIQSFDSLIIHEGRVFTVTPQGKQAVLCELTKKSDLKKDCSDGMTMKMERMTSGNYIIQIQEFKSDKFKYALWLRSEPNPVAADIACVVWLGDGVVGNTDISPMSYKYANSKAFQDFSNSLRNISTEPLINREQLLKIASQYEMQAMFSSGNGWNCQSDRTRIVGHLIAIEGDNRHIQAFEPSKAEH